jgi:hypothetical protein
VSNPFPDHDDSVLEPWERHAHEIIGKMCLASYESSNRMKDGSLRKKRVPYSVPSVAHELIECLNTRNEHRAKLLFGALAGDAVGRMNDVNVTCLE